MKKFILLVLFNVSIIASFAQSLSAGDIAFIQYNASSDDNFKFMALVNISSATEIKFTDNGWQSAGSWRTGEGILTWTAPAGGIAAGTIVEIITTTPSASEGSVSKDYSTINFSTSGDQIIAYQNTSDMIAALNNNGSAVWDADATSSNTSALPDGLTNGSNAVAIDEVDFAKYQSISSGSASEILSQICESGNWDGNNSTEENFSRSFSFVSTGDIMITEIMIDPSGSEPAGEWFEVYNATDSDIDIQGWYIAESSTSHTIDNSGALVVPAYSFVVLGSDATTSNNGGVTIDYDYAAISLNNSGDQLTLMTYASGTTIDEVDFSAWTIPSDASMVFTGSASTDNNTSSNWSTATAREGNFDGSGTDYGSPGINGTSQNQPPASSSISATSNWSAAGNWSNGTPGNVTDVTITSGTITVNQEAACGNLSISGGAVIQISSTQSLTVNGTLTNSNGTSGIILNSDASGTGALIHNSSVSGTVERYTTGPATADALSHYVSAPVSSATGTDILDASLGDYNAYEWDADNSEWDRIFPGTSLTLGKGYYVAYTGDKTIGFEGTLNFEDVNSVSISSTNGNWNLLGNPFTAPVSSSSFVNNNSHINGTLKFWADPDDAHSFASGDYASWTTVSAIGANGKTPGDYIGIGQGFFAESNGSGSTVDFDADWRNAQNPTFFVSSPQQLNRLWLGVEDELQNSNEISLVFLEEATTGFDRLYDSKKLRGNPMLAFFMYQADDETTELDIQGLPAISNQALTVKLGLHAGNGGNYTITLNRLDFTDDYIDIFLEDKVLDKMIDLKEDGQYQVSLLADEYQDRFVLHFNPRQSTGTNENTVGSSSLIYTANNNLYIRLNEKINDFDLMVYNTMGQLLMNKKVKNTALNKIDAQLSQGCYIVYIETDDELITGKVVVN